MIDDDELVRRLVTAILEREGWSVTSAASGREGIALLHGGAFDLVVTDLSMPDGDGRGVLAAAAALRPPVPVVVVTGDVIAGIDGARVVAKPFDPVALIEAARSVMEAKT